MRTAHRRIAVGVVAGLACTATLSLVPVAIASWGSQYVATRALAQRACYRLQFRQGNGACTGVTYRTSGPWNTSQPGTRYFRWYIRYTNRKCPATFHISPTNHIFYAYYDGRCS